MLTLGVLAAGDFEEFLNVFNLLGLKFGNVMYQRLLYHDRVVVRPSIRFGRQLIHCHSSIHNSIHSLLPSMLIDRFYIQRTIANSRRKKGKVLERCLSSGSLRAPHQNRSPPNYPPIISKSKAGNACQEQHCQKLSTILFHLHTTAVQTKNTLDIAYESTLRFTLKLCSAQRISYIRCKNLNLCINIRSTFLPFNSLTRSFEISINLQKYIRLYFVHYPFLYNLFVPLCLLTTCVLLTNVESIHIHIYFCVVEQVPIDNIPPMHLSAVYKTFSFSFFF